MKVAAVRKAFARFFKTVRVVGVDVPSELPASMMKKVVLADTGSVALVTRGKVNRESVTRDAIVMALAPFISPELYS